MADLSDIWGQTEKVSAAPVSTSVSAGDFLKKLVTGQTNVLTPAAVGLGEAGLALASGIPAWLYGRINQIATAAMTGDAEKAKAVEEAVTKQYSFEPTTDFGKHLTEKAGKVMEPLFILGEEIRKRDVEAGMPTKGAIGQLIADLLVPAKAGKAAKAIIGERATMGAKPEIKTAADYRKANESFAEGELRKAQDASISEAEAARAGDPEVANAIREEYGIPEYVAALKERLKAEGVKVQEKADLSDIWTEGEREAYGTTAEVPPPAPEPKPFPQPEAPLALPAGQGFELVKETPQVTTPLPEGATAKASGQVPLEWLRGAVSSRQTPFEAKPVVKPVEAVVPEVKAPEVKAAPAKAKEPWEMTQKEFSTKKAEEVNPKTEKTKAGEQTIIPGASEAETFNLTGSPGEIGTPAPKGKPAETGNLFLSKILDERGSFSTKLIDEARDAIKNTEGAELTENGLKLRLVRYQKPEQSGQRSVRKGVFYLPESKSPYQKYYTTGKNGYGGRDRYEGESTYLNPIIVKGASGGKVPERAYDSIDGKGSYEKMRTDVLANAWTKDWANRKPDVKAIAALLEKYGGDPSIAEEIAYHSKEGNTLPYAIQEHIVAAKLRAGGYDAAIGYNKIGGKTRLSEVFDVREEAYPWENNWKKNYESYYPEGKRKLNDFLNIIKGERGSSPEIGDLSEFGFEMFSDMAESTKEAIKIAAKEAPKAGAFAGEREKGKYSIGEVVKHRSVTGPKGEKLKAPPVFEGEKAIVQNMPDLPKKPMGGWTENPLRTFEQLGTQAKELIYRPVKEAEKVWHEEMTALREEVKKVKQGTTFLSGDRIGMYAIAQQKKGKALLDAMGKKAPTLTPKEMEVYNFMRGKFDDLYQRLQKSRQISGLEPFGKVDNYFTFFSDLSALQEMGFNPITTPMSVMEEAFIHLKATPFGFAKKRSGAIHPIKTDAFVVFDRYADKAIQHINLSPVVAKGRELMGGFDDGFILKNEKPATAKFITDWLDYVAGQKPPQPLPPTVERGLQTINKNLAFSILSANLRSAVIQPSSLVNTVAEIGAKNTLKGIVGLLEFSEGKRSAVADAMKKSNVLMGREFDVNVMESMASVKGALSGARQKAGEIGLKPLQWLDMETARATWIGAYEKAKAEGKIERDAINYADDTVTRTQASAQRSDLSPIQRTTIGKTLTLFQTFTINNFGFLTRDVLGIGNKAITNKEAFAKAGRWIVGTTLINSLFEDVLGTQSPQPSPIHEFMKNQEEGGTVPESVMKAALEAATIAPFLGGARFGSSPFGATADFAKDVAVKLADKPGPKKTWTELGAKTLGVPGVAQVSKTIRGLDQGKSPLEALMGTEKRSMEPSRKLKRATSGNLRKLRGLD